MLCYIYSYIYYIEEKELLPLAKMALTHCVPDSSQGNLQNVGGDDDLTIKVKSPRPQIHRVRIGLD